MHVKLEDKVYITTGKDAGLTGEVIAIDRAKSRVKVSRRNMVKKHKKPNPMLNEEGAIIEKENWLHSSNVSLFVEKDGVNTPVRTGKRYVGQGQSLHATKAEAHASFGANAPARIQKVRVSKDGTIFDEIKG